MLARRSGSVDGLEKLDWAKEKKLEEAAFVEQLRSLAGKQIASTVKYLAPERPVFDVHFVGREFTVTKR